MAACKACTDGSLFAERGRESSGRSVFLHNAGCENRMGMAKWLHTVKPLLCEQAKNGLMKYTMNKTKEWYRRLDKETRSKYIDAVMAATRKADREKGTIADGLDRRTKAKDTEQGAEWRGRSDRHDKREAEKAELQAQMKELDILKLDEVIVGDWNLDKIRELMRKLKYEKVVVACGMRRHAIRGYMPKKN